MILNKIIEDKELAWDSHSINYNDLYLSLQIDQNNPVINKAIINKFREIFLDDGKGIGIIDLGQITNDLTEQKKLYLDIVNMLGNKLKQNIKWLLF